MITTLTPIQTLHNGFLFRSRSEARWCVFFEVLKIRHEYEYEGFDLNGIRYLPDFWLPDLKCYFEVKGEEPTKEEECKARLLSLHSGKRVLIAVGAPWHDLRICGYNWGIKTDCIRFPWQWILCSRCNKAGLVDKMMLKVDRELSLMAGCECEEAKPVFRHTLLDAAFGKARQARFESHIPELA